MFVVPKEVKEATIRACPTCAAEIPADAPACPQCGFGVESREAASPFKAGTVLEHRYRIDVEVGRGGMGVVYRGTDLTLNRPVAIKALLASDADATVLSRFLREARSLAKVEHPGVVRVYAVGREGGVYYMVMKFVEGRTLQLVLKQESPLDAPRARKYLTDVCGALGALHGGGLIHRDLKPGNLIIGPDDRLTVMDLGIVKAVGENTQTTSTALGTPKYMAPEMLVDHNVDARADLYALGVIAYEMLAGEPPFDGPTPMAILYKQAHETPEPLRKKAPTVPRDLAAVVEKLLAKDPNLRFPDAESVIAALSGGLRLDAPRRRPAWLVPGIAGGIIALVAVLVLVLSGREAPPPGGSAAQPAERAVSPAGLPSSTAPAGLPVSGAPAGLPVSGAPAGLPVSGAPAAGLPVSGAPSSTAPASPAPASTAPASTAPASTAPPSAALRMVSVTLTTDPTGALVLESGRPVGRTPLTFKRPLATRTVTYVLRRDGFGEGRVNVYLGADASAHAKLESMFELVP